MMVKSELDFAYLVVQHYEKHDTLPILNAHRPILKHLESEMTKDGANGETVCRTYLEKKLREKAGTN